ncbi:MAG: YbbR-like domain-containing protein [Bacteroidetes bacterium]|nr:YbbR-like domain-containing protein [Bacteroidota bacterium]
MLLWSYVHLSGTYESEIDLPLVVSTPSGFAVSSDLPEKVHARISGPGWRMLLLASTGKSKLKIDLSERDPRDLLGRFYITRDELAATASLPSDVKLLKIEPDSLVVTFSREIARRVPVELRTDVEPAAGYVVVGDPVVTPAFVTVKGSNAIVDSLRGYPTKLLHAHGVRESFNQTIELSDTIRDLLTSRSTNSVNVRVTVEAIAERTFSDVPVSVEALPADRELFLDPPAISVVVRGGVDQLAKLSPLLIKARVVYDATKFDSLQTITPVFETPRGIEVLQSLPPDVRFVLRKK